MQIPVCILKHPPLSRKWWVKSSTWLLTACWEPLTASHRPPSRLLKSQQKNHPVSLAETSASYHTADSERKNNMYHSAASHRSTADADERVSALDVLDDQLHKPRARAARSESRDS